MKYHIKGDLVRRQISFIIILMKYIQIFITNTKDKITMPTIFNVETSINYLKLFQIAIVYWIVV